MSSTDIYLVKDGDAPVLIGSVRNAFRGAMYVWNDIAKRYFGLPFFPLFDEGQMKEVWNADSTHGLKNHEKVVLNSTMDKVTVKAGDLLKLCELFDIYAVQHFDSSIGEQSKILQKFVTENPQSDGVIAWIQTSVSDGWFCEWEDFEDGESRRICDLSESYDLFENTVL